MQCPQCGGDTGVYGTTSVEDNQFRYRECLSCGHVFRTVEMVWGKPVKPRKVRGAPPPGPSLFDEEFRP